MKISLNADFVRFAPIQMNVLKHFDEEECTDEDIEGAIDEFYRTKSEFNSNVVETLEDYSRCSK